MDDTTLLPQALTGMQADRMTRDDAWRLLSVGRQIVRLDFHGQVLAQAFETSAVQDEDGFALVLALFDSAITYRAQFQSLRDVLALLHLLLRNTDNPRRPSPGDPHHARSLRQSGTSAATMPT